MNITAAQTTRPNLPQVPNNGRGRLQVALSYEAPVTDSVELGRIPVDYYSRLGGGAETVVYGPTFPKLTVNPKGESRPVLANVLVRQNDGTPQLENKTVTLVAEPVSKMATSSKWAALGALAGGAAGAVLGTLLGGPILGAVAGTGLASLAGAAFGYKEADADRVRLEWIATPIEDVQLAGFQHSVIDASVRDGEVSYNHKFSPQLEKEQFGWYYEPTVVHYREGEAGAATRAFGSS